MGQVFQSRRFAAFSASSAVVACTGLAAVDGVLSAITPGYDAVGETSSQLMSPDARYSELARISLGLYAVLVIPIAIRLLVLASIRTGMLQKIAAVFVIGGIWTHVVSGVLAALAINDSDSNLIGSITANEIHDMSARIMFGAGLAVLIGASVRVDPSQLMLKRYTMATALLTTAASIVFAFETFTDYNGVLERMIGLLFLAWLSVIALVVWDRGDVFGPLDRSRSL